MKRCPQAPKRAHSLGLPCFLVLAATLPAVHARADDAPQWSMLVSPYTQHWRPSEEHKPVWALGVERVDVGDGSLVGASVFSNSFGQDCTYLYVGQRYRGLWGEPRLFTQWSAGLIYGYRGKFEDKLPLNYRGFAPGAVVTGGWQFERGSSVALHLLGDAGVMLQLAYPFR